jgi:putative flippase GtrA
MGDWRLTLRQAIRFGWVGGISTFVHVLLFDLFVRYGGLPALLANFVAFLGAFLVSFTGHQFWTFREQRGSDPTWLARSLSRYLAVGLTGLALNSLCVFLVVNALGYPHTVAIVFMVLVVPGLLFLLNKLWAFSSRTLSA